MTWIQTFTGRKFDVIDPRSEDVCLEDIAHALSMVCRFGGHSRRFYSVAEHSVRCLTMAVEQKIGGQDFHRAVLLHDAAEAYVGDMVRPLKRTMPDFIDVDARIQLAVHQAFGVRLHPEWIGWRRYIDDTMLATEARDLMGTPPEPWERLPIPLPLSIVPWPMETAERRYLATAKVLELTTQGATP